MTLCLSLLNTFRPLDCKILGLLISFFSSFVGETPSWGCCVVREAVQGLEVGILVTPPSQSSPQISLEVMVDTGCMFTLLLSPAAFGRLCAELKLTASASSRRVTGGGYITQETGAAVHLISPHRRAFMPIYCSSSVNQVPLLGFPALELFHCGVNPAKQIFAWESVFRGWGGYAVASKTAAEGFTTQPTSPLVDDLGISPGSGPHSSSSSSAGVH